jgi:hypothetical protein
MARWPQRLRTDAVVALTPRGVAGKWAEVDRSHTAAGAARARRALLFFTAADVAVSAEAIDPLRDTFSRAAWPETLIGSCDDAPADNGFISQYRNLLHHCVHQTSNPQASTFGAAVLKVGPINSAQEHDCPTCQSSFWEPDPPLFPSRRSSSTARRTDPCPGAGCAVAKAL